jgi:histidyl-tRNA synthetase
MIKSVRGTRDILPPDTALWNFVEATARDVFRAYNFQEIRTPIFESTELFARGVGEETDVVTKEMFENPPRELYSSLEGAIPAFALERAWFDQYHGNYALVAHNEPLTRHMKVDFIAYQADAAPTLVEAKYQPSAKAVADLESKARMWQQPGAKPKLAIAVPEWEATAARKLAPDIEVHSVKMPAWLEPRSSFALRPEATAGIVRAYIEHKLEKRGLNKLFLIGPMFRRERPQKGRYRQFFQIDVESIGPTSSGSESPARDAEVIEMVATLLDRLGIKDWSLQLNSVGCANDRAAFNEALRKALEPVASKMCADCQRRAVTNPLRVFDCKVPEDQPIIETLPRISQFLDEPCRQHFAEVQSILTAVGVEFQLNDRLVRGLDYYTRTAFEFTHGALGAQNAILGGGRYDGLSESLGGPPAPGIGFAIGEDRLVLALQEKGQTIETKPDVYIAPLGPGMNREAARLARELRRFDNNNNNNNNSKGLVVDLGDETFRLKKSFEAADKAGARFILIVGENEVKTDTFALKNLSTGEQVSVPRAELAARIRLSE